MKTSLLPVPLLCVLVALGAGCSRTPPAPPVADAGTDTAARVAPAPPPVPATAMDPCSILDIADVRKVLADARAGVRDRGDEQHGVMLCSWTGTDGRVSLQLHDSPPAAVAREIQERALGLIDPRHADAATAVRVEVVPGVGDATLAFAERVDAARGVRNAGALVVTQKGFRVAAISAPGLATEDRAAALSKLKELARAASGKL